jgi:hypothetical protein
VRMTDLIRTNIPHTDAATCTHPGCAAFRRLTSIGAHLNPIPNGVPPHANGRACEIAMLAAAGTCGLSDPQLVFARRHLAVHVGRPMGGPDAQPIADHRHAVHADHAAQGPDVANPIILGRAEVLKTWGDLDVWQYTDHYVLKFPGSP